MLNFSSFSQSYYYAFKKIDKKYPEVDEVLQKSSVFNFNAASFYDQFTTQRSITGEYHFTLSEDLSWTFFMEEVHIITEETMFYTLEPFGKRKLSEIPAVKTYMGSFVDGRDGYIRLTIHADFFYANIKDGENEFFIEPLKYFDTSARNGSFVLYEKRDIAPKHKSKKCFRPDFEAIDPVRVEPTSDRMQGDCYKVKLALLADYFMYTDPTHPGLDAVIDHIVGVMNNVQPNYEYNGSINFNDGINYEISEVVVSTCPTCDPLSLTQSPSALLTEFSSWVDMDGFYHPFHAAHLWTNRDFIGPTIGLAFQQGNLYCQSRARAVLEDWSSSAALLKTMVAHEIAHNFNGVHDGTTGMILSPTVSVTNTWSSTSKTTISSQIASQASCLTECSPPDCLKLENVIVSNINNSGFNVSWDNTAFQLYTLKVRETGSENFIQEITTINNQITLSPPGYGICKSYDLFVYNNCGAIGLSAVQRIFLKGPTSQGCAEFKPTKSVGWSGVNMSFINNSLNATSYLWVFGSGQSSTLQLPSITYSTMGDYDITLSVNNNAHTLTKENVIQILPDRTPPYTLEQGGNFETNSSDFGTDLVEGSVSLWEYGVSNYVLVTSGKAWKTRLNSDIPQVTTKSALLTPRYNFTQYPEYNLSFDLSMETDFCNAPFAVQLQYSTNNGMTWTRLGGNSFYDAYPGGFCAVQSQVFSDGYGWTYDQIYNNKSIDINFLSGQSSVIFRFVAAIAGGFTGGYNIDGALIDNFKITTSGAPLPLDTYSLIASKEGETSILNWSSMVTSEDIEMFTVYRSSSKKLEFLEIGQIQLKDLDGEDFTFTDTKPLQGLSFYRIGAHGWDGKITYSNIAKIIHSKGTEVVLTPNPVMQGSSINISTSDDVAVSGVYIFDALGREVDQNIFSFERNTNTIEFKNSGLFITKLVLDNGQYFISKVIVH